MMDENQICRLCLRSNLLNYSIFETNFQPKILKYLYLDIRENDILPKYVCGICIQKIENFHQYVLECEQNQTLFVFSTSQAVPVNENKDQEISEIIPITTVDDVQTLNSQSTVLNYITNAAIVHFTQQDEELKDETDAVEYNNFLITDIELKKEEDEPSNVAADDEQLRALSPKANLAPFLKLQKSPCTPKVKRKKPSKAPKLTEQPSEDNLTPAAVTDSQVLDEDFNAEFVCDDEIDDVDELNGIDENSLPEPNILTLKDFPTVIMKNARLLYKGEELMALISKFYRLECDLCLEIPDETDSAAKPTFEKISELNLHYNKVHSIKGYVFCCGHKFISLRSISLHMARHINPQSFRCDECGKLMTCPKILQYHKQNHLPEFQRPLQCSVLECQRRFSYSSALVAHSISHLPESERLSHVCDECGKVFSSPGRLSTHIHCSHTKNGQKFVCHVCAKEFNSKGNLTYHLTTHQAKTMNQVQCTECGKWLKNKLCLRKHSIQHSKILHNCHICEYGALNPQCLRNHIKVKHSDIKAFSCNECGKTFKLKNTLINHEVQHTGVKKYSCQFCSRTFASSGNFYSHRKRIHSAELAAFNIKKEEEEKRQRQEHLAKRNLS